MLFARNPTANDLEDPDWNNGGFFGDFFKRIGSVLNDVSGQSDLLDKSTSINLEQWERETAYNHPKEQVKRLKEAGLNPDLMYGNGGMANTAASAQLTHGTPQSRGVLHGISQAVNAAANLSLLDSEKVKNYSEATRNISAAGEHDVNTQFKLRTFDDAARNIWLQGNYTEQQIKNATAMNEQIGAKTEEIITNVRYINSLIGLTDAKKVTEWKQARLTSSQADYWHSMASHAEDWVTTHIEKFASEVGLNDAYARLMRGQYNLLMSTFNSQVSLLNNQSNYWYFHGFNERALMQLNQANEKQITATLDYIPYIYAGAMYQAEKCFQHDEKGNIIYDEKGHPKINTSYVNYMRFMEQGQAALDMFNTFTNGIKNVCIGAGAVKIGFGSSTPIPIDDPTKNGLDYGKLVEDYQKKQWEKKYSKLYH